MYKKMKTILQGNAVSFKGVLDMVGLTVEERVEKYGEEWDMLVSQYVLHKKSAVQKQQDRLDNLKYITKEAEDCLKKMGVW